MNNFQLARRTLDGFDLLVAGLMHHGNMRFCTSSACAVLVLWWYFQTSRRALLCRCMSVGHAVSHAQRTHHLAGLEMWLTVGTPLQVRRQLCKREMQQPGYIGADVADREYQDKLQGMCLLQRAVCWALAHLTKNKVRLDFFLGDFVKMQKEHAGTSA